MCSSNNQEELFPEIAMAERSDQELRLAYLITDCAKLNPIIASSDGIFYFDHSSLVEAFDPFTTPSIPPPPPPPPLLPQTSFGPRLETIDKAENLPKNSEVTNFPVVSIRGRRCGLEVQTSSTIAPFQTTILTWLKMRDFSPTTRILVEPRNVTRTHGVPLIQNFTDEDLRPHIFLQEECQDYTFKFCLVQNDDSRRSGYYVEDFSNPYSCHDHAFTSISEHVSTQCNFVTAIRNEKSNIAAAVEDISTDCYEFNDYDCDDEFGYNYDDSKPMPSPWIKDKGLKVLKEAHGEVLLKMARLGFAPYIWNQEFLVAYQASDRAKGVQELVEPGW